MVENVWVPEQLIVSGRTIFNGDKAWGLARWRGQCYRSRRASSEAHLSRMRRDESVGVFAFRGKV